MPEPKPRKPARRSSRSPTDPAAPAPGAAAADAWKAQLEGILRQVPGYDPWAHAAGAAAYLDHAAAVKAVNWFADHLKHVEGDARGEPFVLRPWQAAIVGNLFGWKRRDEKGREVRRYRKFLLYCGRGNGKTPLSSGIILYSLFEDGEPGAQCFLAAGQAEQAGFLFRNARGMVEQDPALLGRVTIYGGAQHRSLVLVDDPLSFCKVIPAEAAGQHGGIPHVTLIDELHVQDTRDLVEVFETGMAKRVRAQPLLGMLTTADYDRESICNEVYDHACRVRDNQGDPAQPGYDPAFLPVIYEVPLERDGRAVDWADEAEWAAANPNLGVSVSLESLRAAGQAAQENPLRENAFRRLHLNQRTKQDLRLIPMAAWDACAGERAVAELAEWLKGRRCYGGLDLASTNDLASFTLLFPLDDLVGAEVLGLLSWSWCPADRVVRRARQKFPYDVWQKRGLLTATDGDWIDYGTIQRDVLALRDLYRVQEVGVDPHGADQISQNLIAEGMVLVPVHATFRNLAGPTKEFVRRVSKRKVLHGGNPVLRWAAGNAAAHFDGRLPPGGKIEDHLEKVPVMLSKRKSADKIDPLAAAVLALARLSAHPEAEAASVYETRGIRVL
jgi:phage terminase large subunit-like protein